MPAVVNFAHRGSQLYNATPVYVAELNVIEQAVELAIEIKQTITRY